MTPLGMTHLLSDKNLKVVASWISVAIDSSLMFDMPGTVFADFEAASVASTLLAVHSNIATACGWPEGIKNNNLWEISCSDMKQQMSKGASAKSAQRKPTIEMCALHTRYMCEMVNLSNNDLMS